ncbi:hypothetical protein [Virgibacillus sp. DJP39]
MDFSTVFTMGLGMVFAWGLPIAVVVSIIVLYKKVNRLEKKIEK